MGDKSDSGCGCGDCERLTEPEKYHPCEEGNEDNTSDRMNVPVVPDKGLKPGRGEIKRILNDIDDSVDIRKDRNQ